VVIGIELVLKSRYYGIPVPLLPVMVGIPLWLLMTRRTGLALAVVLLYMGLLDGFIKLKTGGQAATLGRDIVLYAVAIGMVMRARGPFRLPALGGWVLAWALVFLVQLANPGNYSISHAAASLRQDLEFVPLFFIGYAALRSHASLHAFFALLLAIATINGAVAAYQGTLTPGQLATWGPGYNNLVSMVDARTFAGANGQLRVRPPGLGSDEGFSGLLGVTALPGGIALLIAYRRRRWLVALILLGLVGAGIGVLASQSRSYLLTAIVVLLATFGLLAVGHHAKRALVAVSITSAMAAIAVVAIGSYDSGTFSRYSSIAPSNAGSTIYTARSGTWATTQSYMAQIPFGAGLGKVGPAAAKAGGAHTSFNAESEFNFLIVEAGIPALLVFIGFQVALCSTTLKGLRHERDPHTVLLMAALAAPLFGYAVNWSFGVMTTSPPSAPYLWLAAGAISWWFGTPDRVRSPDPGIELVAPPFRARPASRLTVPAGNA
jgi:hypothetical protein